MTSPAPVLPRVQSFLQEALRLPDELQDTPSLTSRIAEHITGNDRLSPAEQADLYRRQFFLRHVDSLRDDHYGIAHYLGDDAFEAFARAYLAQHPPRTPSLRDLGADIARFTDTWSGIPAHLHDLCLDMARYELLFVDLFDAPDVPPVDAKRLAAIPEDAWLTRPLVLTPLLRLAAYRYPVPDLRIAIKEERAASEPPAPEPSFYGIFRRDDAVCFQRLAPEAHDLLQLLLAGEPLASACDTLSRRLSPERAAAVETEVAGWFQRWATWGWILDVEQR
ncbi:MAG: DNA-binding domain-containing protein [Polyangiaceae bacterium]